MEKHRDCWIEDVACHELTSIRSLLGGCCEVSPLFFLSTWPHYALLYEKFPFAWSCSTLHLQPAEFGLGTTGP